MLAVGAALLGSSFVDDPPEPKKTATLEGDLIRFEDREKNLSISYPAVWQRIPSSDPEVVLVTGSAEASLLVRTTSISTPVGRKDIPAAKNLTDRLLTAQRIKNLRPPRRIDGVGGLSGWLYIYSFRDPDSGQRGAHAHYFLFRGKELITLVFQTLPSERFATYARLFDRLADTFRTDASEGGQAQ